MDEIDPRVVQAFSFVEKNEMWDAINILLDASIDVETTYAISGDTQGEDRTHAAGPLACTQGVADISSIPIGQSTLASLRCLGW